MNNRTLFGVHGTSKLGVGPVATTRQFQAKYKDVFDNIRVYAKERAEMREKLKEILTQIETIKNEKPTEEEGETDTNLVEIQKTLQELIDSNDEIVGSVDDHETRITSLEQQMGDDDDEDDKDILSRLLKLESNFSAYKVTCSERMTALTTRVTALEEENTTLKTTITEMQSTLDDVYARTRNYNMGNILVLGEKEDGSQYNAGYSLYNVARAISEELVCTMNLDSMTQRWFDIGLYDSNQTNEICETVRKYISENAVSTRLKIQDQLDSMKS